MNNFELIESIISETIIYQIFYMLRPNSLKDNVNGFLTYKNTILEFGSKIKDINYTCFNDLLKLFCDMCKERFQLYISKIKIIKIYVNSRLSNYITKDFKDSDYEDCIRKTISKSIIKFCEMCENNHEDLCLNKQITTDEFTEYVEKFKSIMKNNINIIGYNIINPNNETVSLHTFRVLKTRYDNLKLEHEKLEKKYKSVSKKYRRMKKDELEF